MDVYLSRKIKNISLLSMIMVVYIHSYNLTLRFVDYTNVTFDNHNVNSFLQNFISQGLTRIAVPLFFIISGFLFFANIVPTFSGFTLKFRKRIKSLLIPYIMWSSWGIVLYLVLQSLPLSQPYFTQTLIIDNSITDLLKTLLIKPLPYQLWFLRDLMIYSIFSPILYICIRRFKIAPILVFFLLWFLGLDTKIVDTQGLFFFALGSYIALEKNSKERKYSKGVIFLFLLWVALNVFLAFLYLEKPWYYLFVMKSNIIIGVYSTWYIYDCISDKMHSNVFLKKLSTYTFFIYAFHEPTLTIFKKFVARILLGFSPIGLLLNYIISPTITIIFSIFVANILRKFFPRFYSLITGNR